MVTNKRKSVSLVELPLIAAGWQGILDAIPAGAYTCDASGLITYCNALARAVWGRAPKLKDPAERYCGSCKLYSSNGVPMPYDECWMALALREGKAYHGREILIEQPWGSRVFGMVYANPLSNAQGQLVGAVNLVVDITAQKKLVDERVAAREIVAKYHNATLAIIEVALGAIALTACAIPT